MAMTKTIDGMKPDQRRDDERKQIRTLMERKGLKNEDEMKGRCVSSARYHTSFRKVPRDDHVIQYECAEDGWEGYDYGCIMIHESCRY